MNSVVMIEVIRLVWSSNGKPAFIRHPHRTNVRRVDGFDILRDGELVAFNLGRTVRVWNWETDSSVTLQPTNIVDMVRTHSSF